ncbi:MAG: hypothetical protein LUG66_06440 [Clostridiales bacterium]|nr:hypothetical protein [Clostridiales bacterium]
MNNINQASRRVPLRAQRTARQSLKRNRSSALKGSFITRLNICITLAAAVLLLSKINTDLTQRLTSAVSETIGETTSFSDVKDKIKDIYSSLSFGETDVFSAEDSEVDKTITKQIEQNKLMEEQLKNR